MDYSKAKIYKVLNDVDDDVYIGSTCQSLCMRMAQHRRDRNNIKKRNRKLYSKMNQIGVEHFFIQLLQEYPECQNVDQLRRYEGEYIKQLKPILNTEVAGRTAKEASADYYQSKREVIRVKHQQYNENNRDEVNERNLQNYYKNKEKVSARLSERIECKICGKELSRGYMGKHLKIQHC